jgi:hypothetical protein
MGVHANPRADAYNSTRYLCVAAELDSNFAHAVIAEVLEEPFLAVAPSFGVDLVPVVCHALNARRRRNVRDVALTAIAAMNLLLNPFGMIATALTWLVTQVAYRRARLRWPQWGTGQAIAVAAIAGGAASVVFGIGLLLPQLILGAVSFAASGPAGGAGFALPLRLSVLFFPLSLLAVWGILRWERLATRSVLVDTLRAETFDPAARALRVEANPGEQERLWIVYQRQRPQNVTAYSGFFPFLGAGEHRDTWSVGIDLDRGAPAGPLENGLRDARKHPQPFSVSELQDHVTRRLEALRSPERPSTGRLEGLIVEDRLFVQGAEVGGTSACCRTRPPRRCPGCRRRYWRRSATIPLASSGTTSARGWSRGVARWSSRYFCTSPSRRGRSTSSRRSACSIRSTSGTGWSTVWHHT